MLICEIFGHIGYCKTNYTLSFTFLSRTEFVAMNVNRKDKSTELLKYKLNPQSSVEEFVLVLKDFINLYLSLIV
jgi:hypothetical protein